MRRRQRRKSKKATFNPTQEVKGRPRDHRAALPPRRLTGANGRQHMHNVKHRRRDAGEPISWHADYILFA
jgi:hypothetical protein